MALAKTAPTKEEFVVKAGVEKRILPAVRLPQIKNIAEEEDSTLKVMLFGPVGSGKTQFLVGPLMAGLKVFVITTDIGGSGLTSVRRWLKRNGRPELAQNLYEVQLNGYEQVKEFLESPTMLKMGNGSTIWDIDPDVLVWDGFSSFQQIDIAEYVGAMAPKGARDNVSEQRESGLQFETADWGIVRNATVRIMEKFMGLTGPGGKPIHKIVTCHEDIRLKRQGTNPTDPSVATEQKRPLLQGAGGLIILGAFDLIMRTKVTTDRGDDDAGSRAAFWYEIQPHGNRYTKNRGFDLPAQAEADPVTLWKNLVGQLNFSVDSAT